MHYLEIFMFDQSNKAVDQAEEMAQSYERACLANADNDSPGYVASRFFELHVSRLRPIPVAPGSDLAGLGLSLVPDARTAGERRGYTVTAGPGGQGIAARCVDQRDGSVGVFQLNTDGHNCVQVTRKLD